MRFGPAPVEVDTDWAPVYPRVIAEWAPGARHMLEKCANNVVEADHGQLKARLLPMRGLKTIRSLRTVAAGHAFARTCVADTTNPPPTCRHTTASASRSANLHAACDHTGSVCTRRTRRSPIKQRNSRLGQPRLPGHDTSESDAMELAPVSALTAFDGPWCGGTHCPTEDT
jgi:hypothetical protein